MIDWLQTRLGISPELQLRLLATLATMVGLWLVHRIALSLVYRRVRDPRSRYRWRKTLTYLVYAVGIVIVGRMWFAWVESFTTIVGFLSAGLAIDRKSTRLNSSHSQISYAVFCLKKKKKKQSTSARWPFPPEPRVSRTLETAGNCQNLQGSANFQRPGSVFYFEFKSCVCGTAYVIVHRIGSSWSPDISQTTTFHLITRAEYSMCAMLSTFSHPEYPIFAASTVVLRLSPSNPFFFFFNYTAPPEISPLPLRAALPI